MTFLQQKENLEKQGWRIYNKLGEDVYFTKENVSGIVVEVNAYTGEAELHTAAPPDFIAKHKPDLI